MAQVELALNAADPPTPITRLVVYAKQDKRLYLKDSSGQIMKITVPSDLSEFALKSDLTGYAPVSSLADYVLKNTVLTALAHGEANTLAYYSNVDTISMTPLSEDGRNLMGANLTRQREILGIALSNPISLNQANTFTEPQTFQKGLVSSGEVREVPKVTNITGSYTIDLTEASIFDLTLVGDCTFIFPEALPGRQFTLVLTQDSTGNRKANWPTTCRWAESSIPALSVTPNTADTFVFLALGSIWLSYLTGLKFTR